MDRPDDEPPELGEEIGPAAMQRGRSRFSVHHPGHGRMIGTLIHTPPWEWRLSIHRQGPNGSNLIEYYTSRYEAKRRMDTLAGGEVILNRLPDPGEPD